MRTQAEIDDWFSANIFVPRRPRDDRSIAELFDLGRQIDDIERDLTELGRQTALTTTDKWIGNVGLLLAIVVGPLVLFTSFDEAAAPVTFVGAAIAVYQFIRDRTKALDTEWYEARLVDLRRLSRQVNQELGERISNDVR